MPGNKIITACVDHKGESVFSETFDAKQSMLILFSDDIGPEERTILDFRIEKIMNDRGHRFSFGSEGGCGYRYYEVKKDTI